MQRRTPSRRRSSDAGATSGDSATPIGSRRGSTASWSMPAAITRVAGGAHCTMAESCLRTCRQRAMTTRRLVEHEALEGAFLTLSADHRIVLLLAHYAGYSAPEIATILGVPTGTVYSRLHYAMRAMRAALAPTRARRSGHHDGGTAMTHARRLDGSRTGWPRAKAMAVPWRSTPRSPRRARRTSDRRGW